MMIKEIRSIIEQEADAVRRIPVTEHYTEAVDLIVKHVHDQGGKLITSGMGKAGQIAMNIATTFSSTGTPAFFLHPSEAQHGDLGIVCPNDVMLLVSNSGKTRELLELVQLTRGLVEDIPFIVITSDPESRLAQEAAVCLPTGAPKEVCALGLTPTTSTTVMTVIGNVSDSRIPIMPSGITGGIWGRRAVGKAEWNRRSHAAGDRYRRNDSGYNFSGQPAACCGAGRLNI